MKVTIDPYAGFCFGVERAIRIAEENVLGEVPLKSLGSIVHNEQEKKRLEKVGLRSIPRENFVNMKHGRILFRAHGEVPGSYKIACRNNTRVVDATCPVVKKLQSRVEKASKEVLRKNGVVVIFGRKEHPEVEGLLGYVTGESMVLSNLAEAEMADLPPVVRLFAQTTKGNEDYLRVQATIRKRLNDLYGTDNIDFKSYNTICRQVSVREKHIREFAANHDVILFVGGKESSNGRLLFDYARTVNPRSYYIAHQDEIKPEWFAETNTVGITGATSTPDWLMKDVGQVVEKL